MSYILDALRKADAQRERDPARGIHAQPMQAAIGPQQPSRSRQLRWVLTASAAGVAALAASAWYLYRDDHAVAVAQPALGQPQAPASMPASAPNAATAPGPAALGAPAYVPAPAGEVLPPAVPAAPPAVAAPSPAPAPPVAAPAGAAPAAGTAASPPGIERSVGSTPPLQPGGAAVPSPAATPGSPSLPPMAVPAPAARALTPAASAPPVTGLPPDAPKLVISGGVYSANRASRMLIVNGQVFSEGAELGSGVMLEEIKPGGAVLKFRGSRYSVTY